MKQHIIEGQLRELSDSQKMSLLKFVRREDDYQVKYGKVKSWPEIDGKNGGAIYLPLLSIGQMLEFLIGNDWEYYFELNKKRVGIEFKWDGELCDALWEAVKEVLNE